LGSESYFPAGNGNRALTPISKPGSRRLRINLVSSAISILLHRPELAASQPEANVLNGLREPNIELLIELLRYLQETPGASLGTLVVDWQQDPQRQPHLMLLNEIAHLDPVLGDIDAGQLLSETMQRLIARHSEARIDELLKKSRQTPLTDDEKQQLQTLLTRRS
jgi:DNA primase